MMISKAVVLLSTVVLLELVTGLPQPNCGCEQSPTTTTPAPCACEETVCEACPTCSYDTINVTIQTGIETSPLFFYLFKEDDFSDTIDSQCGTILPFNNNTIIFFITTTQFDGTVFVQAFFQSNGPQGPGTFEFVGLAGSNTTGGLVYYGYAIDSTCVGCSQTICYISNILAEDCYQQGSYINQYTGYTSTLQPEDCCLSQAKAILEARSGKNTIIRAPYNLPVTCVGSFNGLPVSNLNTYLGNPQVTFIDYPSFTPISG